MENCGLLMKTDRYQTFDGLLTKIDRYQTLISRRFETGACRALSSADLPEVVCDYILEILVKFTEPIHM